MGHAAPEVTRRPLLALMGHAAPEVTRPAGDLSPLGHQVSVAKRPRGDFQGAGAWPVLWSLAA